MNTTDTAIRQISAAQTFDVRHPVLRAGKPIESCHFPGDDFASTSHFGFYDNGRLAGVASIFESSNPYFQEPRQIQLRGMAVLADFRGKHVGERLVLHCEKFAMKYGSELIWFNAREIAIGFYEKCGYVKTGHPFNIGDIGIHYVMFKKLQPK